MQTTHPLRLKGLAAYLRAMPNGDEPNKIQYALDYVNLSQRALAVKAEVSRYHLADIIRGDSFPTVPVARRIADVLGVGIDDLWPRLAA